MTTKSSSAEHWVSGGHPRAGGDWEVSPRGPPPPGAWEQASHPSPSPSPVGEEPGWSQGQPRVTYAIWEALLRLYFCMTPWNRPKWAEPLSGGAVDLEGAGQE